MDALVYCLWKIISFSEITWQEKLINEPSHFIISWYWNDLVSVFLDIHLSYDYALLIKKYGVVLGIWAKAHFCNQRRLLNDPYT